MQTLRMLPLTFSGFSIDEGLLKAVQLVWLDLLKLIINIVQVNIHFNGEYVYDEAVNRTEKKLISLFNNQRELLFVVENCCWD